MENDYDPALGQAAEALAKRWHTSDFMAVGSKGPQGASTLQMAELYGLDNSKNAEIRGSWYKLAINAGISAAVHDEVMPKLHFWAP